MDFKYFFSQQSALICYYLFRFSPLMNRENNEHQAERKRWLSKAECVCVRLLTEITRTQREVMNNRLSEGLKHVGYDLA